MLLILYCFLMSAYLTSLHNYRPGFRKGRRGTCPGGPCEGKIKSKMAYDCEKRVYLWHKMRNKDENFDDNIN